MKCIYLKIRSKKYQKYFYCNHPELKCNIEEDGCYHCKFKEYKIITPIKKKSNSLQRAEDNRKSILQDEVDKCYMCERKIDLDTHEAIGGMNRLTSIKWDLIFYLCRKCHSKLDLNQNLKEELQVLAQDKFVELYGYEKFMEEFKMDYKEKYNKSLDII